MRQSDVVPYTGPTPSPTSFPIVVSPVAPSPPTLGAGWLNSTTNVLSVFDGAAWVPASGGTTTPFLPLAGGTLVAGANVNFNTGTITNVIIDEGRY
jgi:hypothetical protein